MKRILPVFVALAVVLAGCDTNSFTDSEAPASQTAANSASGNAQSDNAKIPGQYIVVFNDNVGNAPAKARQMLPAGGEMLHTYEHAIKGFAGRFSAQAAEALKNNPNVADVEPDRKAHAITTTQSGATWGLDRSDARSGLDDAYSYNATGSGVTAYVIDTGINTSHNDFGSRASVGFDAIGDGQNGQDCNGHGTHVAGTVGGNSYGIAKGVSLVAVRVLDCEGSGTNSGVIAGVDWVTNNAQKPAVANMSLGGGASDALDTAVQNSIDSGVQYAVAAGNGDFLGREADACNYSPARVPAAMTVGATDNTDTKASFSNYGSCVDWFSPGVDITSAWIGGDSATNTISGTSMASPHTAGIAALYLEGNTGASPQQVRDAVYSETTKGVVTDSRTSNNHLTYALNFGGGTDDGGGDTNTAPSAGFSVTTADLTADFTDESSDSDGSVSSYSWDFGDGATSTAQNPSHTYASEGTYTVTLTVTDDAGATDTATQNVTVSRSSDGGGGTNITLSVSGRKVKGRHTNDLSWSGATTSNVDVYLGGSVLTTTANDGAYTHSTNNRGKGSYAYKVCEAGTSTCSSEATVTY